MANADELKKQEMAAALRAALVDDAPDPRDLTTGMVMVVHGLTSSTALNGAHVEVLNDAPFHECARVAVRVLDRSARGLLVKLTCLRSRTRYERTCPLAKLLAPSLGPFVFERSADGVESNLLVLLHGLGDTAANFAAFGRRLKLPQTSVLSVTAPMRLPFEDMGSGWYLAFEQDGSLISEPMKAGDQRRCEGLRCSSEALSALLRALVQKCNWREHELFILGFSQGGTVAVDAATHAEIPLGGVVGVSCACVLPEDMEGEHLVLQSPLITLHGTCDDSVPIALSRATRLQLRERLAQSATKHEFVELDGGKHSTPQNAEQTRPLMEFFSRHLRSRNTALDDDESVVEVTPG
ncbi:Phospholipase/Carboxylesterase-domain-containing protein [Pavlovales sp. CCMP2436]|nr:Phospholipase/Carboxylesterase-domain-containing protein [Pavlovales sp. CCMP2436]